MMRRQLTKIILILLLVGLLAGCTAEHTADIKLEFDTIENNELGGSLHIEAEISNKGSELSASDFKTQVDQYMLSLEGFSSSTYRSYYSDNAMIILSMSYRIPFESTQELEHLIEYFYQEPVTIELVEDPDALIGQIKINGLDFNPEKFLNVIYQGIAEQQIIGDLSDTIRESATITGAIQIRSQSTGDLIELDDSDKIIVGAPGMRSIWVKTDIVSLNPLVLKSSVEYYFPYESLRQEMLPLIELIMSKYEDLNLGVKSFETEAKGLAAEGGENMDESSSYRIGISTDNPLVINEFVSEMTDSDYHLEMLDYHQVIYEEMSEEQRNQLIASGVSFISEHDAKGYVLLKQSWDNRGSGYLPYLGSEGITSTYTGNVPIISFADENFQQVNVYQIDGEYILDVESESEIYSGEALYVVVKNPAIFLLPTTQTLLIGVLAGGAAIVGAIWFIRKKPSKKIVPESKEKRFAIRSMLTEKSTAASVLFLILWCLAFAFLNTYVLHLDELLNQYSDTGYSGIQSSILPDNMIFNLLMNLPVDLLLKVETSPGYLMESGVLFRFGGLYLTYILCYFSVGYQLIKRFLTHKRAMDADEICMRLGLISLLFAAIILLLSCFSYSFYEVSSGDYLGMEMTVLIDQASIFLKMLPLLLGISFFVSYGLMFERFGQRRIAALLKWNMKKILMIGLISLIAVIGAAVISRQWKWISIFAQLFSSAGLISFGGNVNFAYLPYLPDETSQVLTLFTSGTLGWIIRSSAVVIILVIMLDLGLFVERYWKRSSVLFALTHASLWMGLFMVGFSLMEITLDVSIYFYRSTMAADHQIIVWLSLFVLSLLSIYGYNHYSRYRNFVLKWTELFQRITINPADRPKQSESDASLKTFQLPRFPDEETVTFKTHPDDKQNS